MAKKYRIGVIGHTGRGNYGHGLDTVWGELPNCEVVAVADADESGRKATADRIKAPKAFADYRQMLDEVKPDIVAVAPRWVDHRRLGAWRAGELRALRQTGRFARRTGVSHPVGVAAK